MFFVFGLVVMIVLINSSQEVSMFFSGKRPDNLGVKSGQLATVTKSPNCVSSQNDTEKYGIKPFTFNGDPVQEMTRLKDILGNMKGVTIITSEDGYIYAECKTPLMGFVDDLEFYFDPENIVIHVRSASRLGYRDFDVNRNRVEEIRSLFEQ